MHVEILWRFLAIYRGTQRRFPPKCIENTFQATQSTCRSLEMHSKRRCKICTCSVILDNLSLFEITRASLLPYFPEMFRCNLTFNESENFLIPLSITFLNPKNLGLLFCEK